MASVTYGPDANAMYVRVSNEKKKIKKTISLGEDRLMEIDGDCHVMGFLCFPYPLSNKLKKLLINLV